MRKNPIFERLASGLAARAIVVAVLTLACSAGPVRDRFAISPERISSVLQQAGIRAKSTQVEFLSPVSSMAENPQLTIVNIARWRDGKFKALLRCRNNRECLPFYVVIHDNDTITPAVSANFLSAIQGEFSTKRKPRKRLAEKPLVRGGQRATLIMKNRNLRITLPVICLESGKRGETIRLSSPDRKQKYTGEVVEAGLLEGNF